MTDVIGEVFRNVIYDLLGEGNTELFDLFLNDSCAKLEIRWIYVCYDSALKSCAQALLKALYITRRKVGNEDYPFS